MALRIYQKSFNLRHAFQGLSSISSRNYSDAPLDPPSEAQTTEPKLSGFAKAFDKFAALDLSKNEQKKISKLKSSKSFVSLLRHSKFMQVSNLI